jgi:cobalt/nickel transport system permease protein
LHHLVIEGWSRRSSVLHARDARVKVVVLAAFLAALGTTTRMSAAAAACWAALLGCGVLLGRLPALALAARAAAVLPFSGVFALFSALEGDAARAANLLTKSYLSAAAVLVLAGTTPLPRLLGGMESLGAPRFLVLVVQFLYRYLFVISEQAQHMRLAAVSRASRRRIDWRRAAGAVSVLFAKSYARADGIHHAMVARGFTGKTELLAPARLVAADGLFLAAGVAAIVGLRAALSGWWV